MGSGVKFMSPESVKVYSVKEVAQILQTTRQQVRKMILNEEIAAVKVGREWRIPAERLEEFLENTEVI